MSKLSRNENIADLFRYVGIQPPILNGMDFEQFMHQAELDLIALLITVPVDELKEPETHKRLRSNVLVAGYVQNTILPAQMKATDYINTAMQAQHASPTKIGMLKQAYTTMIGLGFAHAYHQACSGVLTHHIIEKVMKNE